MRITPAGSASDFTTAGAQAATRRCAALAVTQSAVFRPRVGAAATEGAATMLTSIMSGINGPLFCPTRIRPTMHPLPRRLSHSREKLV